MLLNCGVGEDSWESLGLHRIAGGFFTSWAITEARRLSETSINSSCWGHQTLSFDYFVYNTLIRVVSHSILRTAIKKELALMFLPGLRGGWGAQYTLCPAVPCSALPCHPALCRWGNRGSSEVVLSSKTIGCLGCTLSGRPQGEAVLIALMLFILIKIICAPKKETQRLMQKKLKLKKTYKTF